MSSQIKPAQLSFFITPPHQCPYLEEKESRTLFLSPEILTDKLLYSALINRGFRRSGEHIYRPHCDQCKECISVRIPVEKFAPNKQQKRCLKKGRTFYTMIEPSRFTQQHYLLFDKYISERHRDGDMFPTSTLQYREFLLNDWLETNYLNFFDIKTNRLIATCVYDVVNNGLSAVYTFFDPDFASFSLGRLAILKLIEIARAENLEHVYLGYWIKNSRKNGL